MTATMNSTGSGRRSVSRPHGLSSITEGCNGNTLDRQPTVASIHQADYDAGIFRFSIGVGFNPFGNRFITFIMEGFNFFFAVLVLQPKREEKGEFERTRELVREMEKVNDKERNITSRKTIYC